MRIDLVSIFPDYFTPLGLSLPGKARDKGLLDIAVHDLRQWAHDRHRTVDDTPYGGGAGMVMRPEPWGEALDALVRPTSTVVFTTPSGEPFTQATARDLATREHLVFACGRYEGIDQRVVDHAREVAEVREVSLGDYVLNGGEVAALAITEAVVRLLPGFMGNPDSLVEESHEDGLLEYPVYTKPATWRERAVPPVLLSGNHAAVADWRHDEAVRRTLTRRPDLLPATAASQELEMVPAVPSDAGELLTLQRACWMQEALANERFDIPALHETLEEVRAWLGEWQVWVARVEGRLVAAVRARCDPAPPTWDIGRLMIAPDLQGRGLGRALLEFAEAAAPAEVTAYQLFTGGGSAANLRRYKKAGYRPVPPPEGAELPGGAVLLHKRRPPR